MKKFLSFFLVICMLISAVPALLLPVFAEEGEVAPNKIFSYADAYPNFTAKIDSEKAYKYMGNDSKQDVSDEEYKAWLRLPETFAVSQGDYAWKIGAYVPSTNEFEPIARVAFFAGDYAEGHDVSWFITEAKYQESLDAYIAAAAESGSASIGIWSDFAIVGQRVFNGFTCTDLNKTVAAVYTVEEEGNYKFFFQGDTVENGANGHQVAILVNGTPVWPAGATISDSYDGWYTTSSSTTTEVLNAAIEAVLPEIELYAGDEVTFAVHGGHLNLVWTPALEQLPAPEAVQYSFRDEFLPGLSFNLSEDYRNQPVDGEPFADDAAYAEWLKSEGVFAVNQGNSNWKVGEYKIEDDSFDLFSRIAFTAGDNATGLHDRNWVVTESVYMNLVDQYVETGMGNIWVGYALWHLQAPYGASGLGRLTNSGSTTISAIQYTASESGSFGIQLGAFAEYGANGHKLAILKNGEPVWPLGATKSTETWYTTSKSMTLEAMNEVLKALSIKVAAGDKITFCTSGAGDAMIWEPIMIQQPSAPVYLVLSDPYGSMTQSIKVRPGTTMNIPAYTSDLVFLGWDANGDGKADYQDGAEITIGEDTVMLTAVNLSPSKFAENLPTWDADTETVKFSGGWSLGVWEKETMTYLPVAYDASGIFLTSNAGGPWGTTGGGIYYTSRVGLIVITGTVLEGEAAGPYIHSIQKTVDYNGTVQLDFDQLTIGRELSNGGSENPVSGGMAVYVGGEKVWPADEDYFWFTSPELYTGNMNYDFRLKMMEQGTWPFPLNLDVEMGETIDIRTVQGNPDNWMFYYKPAIYYKSVTETPTVSHTGLDIGKDFTLNIYSQILAMGENSVAGMEYWTTEPTAEQLTAGGTAMELIAEEGGLYKFAYTGLTAKQMTDLIYVRPYTTTEGGEKINGKVVAVSIKDYAMAAIGSGDTALDNLLVAMLNYGAKAQALFDYNVDNLANKDLTVEQKRLSADASALVNAYANADGDNKIKSVSLILGTDLGFKFMIDSVEGATAYEIEISKSADFADSTKIAMTSAWEGKEQKAICNISFADMDETFYVRAVVDGTAGATLTYSVESFIVRMGDHPDMGLYDAIMALACFNQMIVAYGA